MEQHTENLVPNDVRRLLSTHLLQIEPSTTNEDLTCAICKNIMLNAYQASCGCHYCYQCIYENMQNGGKYCNGTKVECREEALLLDGPNANILRSPQLNKKILKAKVICPNESCTHSTELSQMDDHLRVCLKQPMKCPYASIGCHDDTSSRQQIEVHMSTAILTHTQLLIESIDDVKNDIKSLREDFKRKEVQIQELEKVYKNNQVPYSWKGIVVIALIIVFIAYLYLMTMNKFSENKFARITNESNKISEKPSLNETRFTVNNFKQLKNAKKCQDSPYFYSHLNGYKLQILICTQYNDSMLSVFMKICKGEYHSLLSWPCKYSFILGIVNQTNGMTFNYKPMNYENAIETDKQYFHEPQEECHGGYGYPNFAPYELIESSEGIVVNDSIVIKLTYI